jgi:hypothetical protein
MEKNERFHNHGFRRVFHDILRDTNSVKYSMTKFAALVGLSALSATIIMSILIMWEQKEVDHVLIVELIGFVLTLLGFKNSFGYKGNNGSITTSGNDSAIINNASENSETDPDAGKKLNKESDDTNDSLKG